MCLFFCKSTYGNWVRSCWNVNKHTSWLDLVLSWFKRPSKFPWNPDVLAAVARPCLGLQNLQMNIFIFNIAQLLGNIKPYAFSIWSFKYMLWWLATQQFHWSNIRIFPQVKIHRDQVLPSYISTSTNVPPWCEYSNKETFQCSFFEMKICSWYTWQW